MVKGNFKPLSINESGIYVPSNGKAMVKLLGAQGDYLMAASQNKDALKVFELKRKVKTINILPDDIYAIIKYKRGTTTRQEFYNGTSFLSQSGRFLNIEKSVESVKITNNKNQTRFVH